MYLCELDSIDYLSPKLEIAKVRANFREAMFCDVLPEMTFLITATDTTLHRRPGETAEVLDDRHVKDITWLSQDNNVQRISKRYNLALTKSKELFIS